MPHRILITNQKGGVAKTTTVVNLARHFADRGKRVLVVDTDPQGQIATMMSKKPLGYLVDLLIRGRRPQECITEIQNNIWLLPSDRSSAMVEGALAGMAAREAMFRALFESFDHEYDVVVIDSAPSISMMQTCALVYAGNYLIPLTLDLLAVQGAIACVEMARFISDNYSRPVRPLGLVPTMVDRRLSAAYEAGDVAQDLSTKFGIPILHGIRTDQNVNRVFSRRKAFLADLVPMKSKAYDDYTALGDQILELLNGQTITAVPAPAAEAVA
jgi:chromosome partitioning protein